MKHIPFWKYQGAGNDFIMLDQREQIYLARHDQATIEQLCDRRFGIGADGLILLQHADDTTLDFEMIYFNADGCESSMCGNGGRCIVAFATFVKAISAPKTTFLAIDGIHDALILPENNIVSLKMTDVTHIESGKDFYLLNTGSPHFVVFVEDLRDIDVYETGREIRYSERFRKAGVNVNFVQVLAENHLQVATYERGVEAETYACGTGATAAAIAYFAKSGKSKSVQITTKGGTLAVRFESEQAENFTNIWLSGEAKQVFSGVVTV